MGCAEYDALKELEYKMKLAMETRGKAAAKRLSLIMRDLRLDHTAMGILWDAIDDYALAREQEEVAAYWAGDEGTPKDRAEVNAAR